MDALALLCNLHADGPGTLDELHRIGVRGLEDVLGAQSTGLVGELGWSPAAADRFVREAGHLRARLGETLSDPEESSWTKQGHAPETLEPARPQAAAEGRRDVTIPVQLSESASDSAGPFGDPQTNRPAAALEHAAVLDQAATLESSGVLETASVETSLTDGFPATAVEATPRGGVDSVLQRWRELDEVAPLSEPVRVTVPEPAGTPISNNVHGALDAGSLERLSQMGIESLEQLLETSALELARGLRTGFSRATRLQFLARRALAEMAKEQPLVESSDG